LFPLAGMRMNGILCTVDKFRSMLERQLHDSKLFTAVEAQEEPLPVA